MIPGNENERRLRLRMAVLRMVTNTLHKVIKKHDRAGPFKDLTEDEIRITCEEMRALADELEFRSTELDLAITTSETLAKLN